MTTLTLVGSRYFVLFVLQKLQKELNHDGNAYTVQDDNGVIVATTIVGARRGQVHRVVADAYAEVEPFLLCITVFLTVGIHRRCKR